MADVFRHHEVRSSKECFDLATRHVLVPSFSVFRTRCYAQVTRCLAAIGPVPPTVVYKTCVVATASSLIFNFATDSSPTAVLVAPTSLAFCQNQDE